MRFSSIFQQPSPPYEVQREESPREQATQAAAPQQELPEDLDARVRLIGEWQLGEA